MLLEVDVEAEEWYEEQLDRADNPVLLKASLVALVGKPAAQHAIPRFFVF